MTNIDKVRRVAEWCGWREVLISGGGGHWWVTPDNRDINYDECFTTLNACAEFEAVAKERGLLRKYISVLWHAATEDAGVKYSSNPGDHVEAIWMTTPAQRVEAILAVIGESGVRSDGD